MVRIVPQGFKKRNPRVKVRLPSRMRVNATWTDACIHDVSARGLLVASEGAPDPGAYVEIRRGQTVIIGRAIWKKGTFFGVRTQDLINLAVLRGEAARGATPASAGDRRTGDRLGNDAAIHRTGERNRALSRLLQFGVLAAATGIAAVIAAIAVYDILAAPVDRIAQGMANQ